MRGTSHAKYSIHYHIILTTKYRKHLLVPSLPYDKLVKGVISRIADEGGYILGEMESDKDHLHFLIETKPRISPSLLIKTIKQQTTHEVWDMYGDQLRKDFWKKRSFWSPSYFVSSVGVVDLDAVSRYISTQGISRNPIHPRT